MEAVPEPGLADHSWQSYRYLADNAIDVVLEASLTTEMRWVSPSVEDVLGWAPDELVGKTADALVHPDDIGAIMELAEAINQHAARVRSARVRLQRKDGRYVPLQLRGRPALGPDGAVVGHIITMQDTSERDDALRALSVLSEGNRVLARTNDEQTLLREMCETVVAVGAYPLAWYGARIDDDARSVRPLAVSGPSAWYVDELRLSWGDDELGLGPTGTALRTGTTQVRHDLVDDPVFAPWLERASRAGLRSSITLPVVVDGAVDGGLMVYATETSAFDDRAQQLLETLASDLGVGLHRLRSIRALSEKTAEIERQSAALSASEARYRLLAENSSDVVLLTAPLGGITWASESAHSVLGWSHEEMVGRGVELIHEEDRPTVVALRRDLELRSSASGEVRVAASDGSWRWMAYSAHRAVDGDGSPVDVVALRDIDEAVRARAHLEHVIGHDRLTGLAARPVMLRRIDEALDRLGPGRFAAVLCIGIDRLSVINQAYTHAAGDTVIATVAARIAGALDSPDSVGRGTGVEFLAVVPDLVAGDAASGLASRILEAVRGPVPLDLGTVEPTVSIGIAIGHRGSSSDQLVREATAALGQAKASGRDRFLFADASLADVARRRLEVDRMVRAGLADDRFTPYFQPVVDLATGRLTGYEALVRLIREDGGLIPPDSFLPVAEQSALICEIDLVVLRASLEALAAMPDPLTVAVNLSTVTLTRPEHTAEVERVLRGCGSLASRLHLEVTETALLAENERVGEVMTAVAATGVRWYVDDFGTGYSSISHLRDLPVSGLKLDVSFAAGIRAGDTTSLRLAQALAGLAHGLELDSVAEGVETAAEASTLAQQGWLHGQGWLFGRPAPLG